MERNISIKPVEPNCDSIYHAVVGYKDISNRYKEKAKQWFENVNVKSLSYRALLNDAILAVYNVDNKIENNPISEAIEQSGAHLDNPLAANMELKFMPVAHELGVLVEMRMKALILAEGNEFSYVHHLPTLWDEIDSGVRREIERHYSNQIRRKGEHLPSVISEGNITEDLEVIGEDFIAWRYESKPDFEVHTKFMKLNFLNHVLEYAMLKYRD